MKFITLTKGLKTAVSDQTYEWAKEFSWQAHSQNGFWYAVRSEYDRDAYVSGKASHTRTVLLHREIAAMLGLSDVDHRDGDTLNNQDENLRPCTRAQNCWNQKRRVSNTSGFKGVNWKKGCPSNPWIARLSFNKQRIQIGHFSTAEEAAKAYDRKAQELFGEFARLNFPDQKR